MLVHEKGRNLLAVAGIFIAVLMIFLQLGFYSAVPKGALQVYNHLRFDLLMASSSYIVQTLPFDFAHHSTLPFGKLAVPEPETQRDPYPWSSGWINAGPNFHVVTARFLAFSKRTPPILSASLAIRLYLTRARHTRSS